MKRLDELDLRPTDHIIATGSGSTLTWLIRDVDAGVIDDLRELQAQGWKLYHYRPTPTDPLAPLVPKTPLELDWPKIGDDRDR